MNNDVTNRVSEIQASMVEFAKLHFDVSELGHLRGLIRLTVEFRYYLEHGSVKIATRMLNGPHAKYAPDARGASTDPFNKYDLEFTCESIRSGVDSFCSLNLTCSGLPCRAGGGVKWGMFSSRESFKAQFISMFNEFVEEKQFENRCRLLLDLFKLQMAFAAIYA